MLPRGLLGGDELPDSGGAGAATGPTPARGVVGGSCTGWKPLSICATRPHHVAPPPLYFLTSRPHADLHKATPSCCSPQSRTLGHRGDDLDKRVCGLPTPLGVLLCDGWVPESTSPQQRQAPSQETKPHTGTMGAQRWGRPTGGRRAAEGWRGTRRCLRSAPAAPAPPAQTWGLRALSHRAAPGALLPFSSFPNMPSCTKG